MASKTIKPMTKKEIDEMEKKFAKMGRSQANKMWSEKSAKPKSSTKKKVSKAKK